MNIYEKLDKIEPAITKSDFLENKGLGNEVGYFIFDYEPEYEIIVREYVEGLIEKQSYSFKIVEYDLYEILIDHLKEKKYIKKCKEIEEKKGMKQLVKAITSLLRMGSGNDLFTRTIKENTPDSAVVFITGIGKIFPFVRSHKILNNLHLNFYKSPVVMFYPGKYDGQSLSLFGEFKDDNYYRAFPLIK
ncbi:DUF1788 domain-containing protein [Miniphocaeibacter halophilus]|uniref:DUF1788 domain-containing protein n=1 Tax=Miniphocaeibacter halophilus TaxID=2931922 RepID=A0AC61MRP7_9FIRM|nr:DUF1788 domain-containing protein [Miniphocaeibacter halophilus]QQK06963.1 DUF1788 domain-containing protein [Miniphocaeibacter halophilus]